MLYETRSFVNVLALPCCLVMWKILPSEDVQRRRTFQLAGFELDDSSIAFPTCGALPFCACRRGECKMAARMQQICEFVERTCEHRMPSETVWPHARVQAVHAAARVCREAGGQYP